MTDKLPAADRPLTAGGDWIEWHGGENPVPGQMVNIRHRGLRDMDDSEWAADLQCWRHSLDNREASASDIIAYRLSRPAASDEGAGEPDAWQCRIYNYRGEPGDWKECERPEDPTNLRPSRIVEFRPLAASPPAREEAPDEGAGELDRQIGILRRAAEIPPPDDDSDFDIEKARRGAESWREIARNTVSAYEALRARTSEPAREAVAWPCGPNPIGDPMEAVQHPNGRWCVEQVVDDGAICMTWFDGPYAEWRARNYARTHPAPATADKLKVAKEALEKADAAARSAAAMVAADYRVDPEKLGETIYKITTPALATLNEEGNA